MTLSGGQIDLFRERGWLNLGPVFDAAELAEIGAAYDEALRHPLELGEKGKGKFAFSPLLHIQSPALLRHATSPKIVAPVLDLLGPDVRLYWDQAVSKPPGATSEVPWHQDNGYTPVIPEAYVTCTLALDDMRRDNGCLWVLPDSHRRGATEHRRTDYFFYVGYDGDDEGVPLEIDAGDALLFSSLLLHRSGANVSTRPRRSWVIQYCHGHAVHGATKVPFDDRLLVAKGGAVLAEPYRERELDLKALLSEA